jgi:hypothetical protein
MCLRPVGSTVQRNQNYWPSNVALCWNIVGFRLLCYVQSTVLQRLQVCSVQYGLPHSLHSLSPRHDCLSLAHWEKPAGIPQADHVHFTRYKANVECMLKLYYYVAIRTLSLFKIPSRGNPQSGLLALTSATISRRQLRLLANSCCGMWPSVCLCAEFLVARSLIGRSLFAGRAEMGAARRPRGHPEVTLRSPKRAPGQSRLPDLARLGIYHTKLNASIYSTHTHTQIGL